MNICICIHFCMIKIWLRQHAQMYGDDWMILPFDHGPLYQTYVSQWDLLQYTSALDYCVVYLHACESLWLAEEMRAIHAAPSQDWLAYYVQRCCFLISYNFMVKMCKMIFHSIWKQGNDFFVDLINIEYINFLSFLEYIQMTFPEWPTHFQRVL